MGGGGSLGRAFPPASWEQKAPAAPGQPCAQALRPHQGACGRAHAGAAASLGHRPCTVEGVCEAAWPVGGPGVGHCASALHSGWRQPARGRLPWFLPVLPSPVLQGRAAPPLWPCTQGPRLPAAEPSTAPTSPSGRALPDMVRHRVMSRPQVRWCGASGSRPEIKVHQAIISPEVNGRKRNTRWEGLTHTLECPGRR